MARERRADQTLREVATEIGISPATLLRVESGRIPDVATFGKICLWLEVDPSAFLGVTPALPRAETGRPGPVIGISAHFRADQISNPDTINALAQMLLLAAEAQQRQRPQRNEHA